MIMARKTKKIVKSAASRQNTTGSARRSPLYNDVIGIAGTLLRSRQEAGAEKIESLAGAARNFAEELQDIPHIQTYVEAAADQMAALAGYVTETDLETMVADAGDLAKRYPLATTAFTVAAGFAFTRLMAGSFTGQNNTKSSHKNVRGKPKGQSNTRRAGGSKQGKANGRDSSHTASHTM
jgi:hypothetical protein